MKFSLLSFFILFTYALQAQVKLGVKAGAHLGNWDADAGLFQSEEEFNSNIAFLGGFIAEFGLSQRLALQTELFFLQKGTKIKSRDFFSDTEVTSKFVLNYLELPVLLKFLFNESADGPTFYGVAGPSVGYALSGKFTAEAIINGEKVEESEDIEFSEDDDFRRTEFSAALGAGVNIPAGAGQFMVDLRYLLGLSNLNDGDDDFSIQNRGFSLAVGYIIPIGTNNTTD